jgi:hypothetical protein
MSGSRRIGWIKWALAASVACAYWACQEDETRPDGIGDCADECSGGPSPIIRPPVSTPGAGGSAGAGAGAGGSGGGSAGSAGSAGSSSMNDTLSGSIQQLSLTLTTDPLNGTLKVQAAGADVDQVSVDSESTGDFRLVDVNRTLPLWVGVGPFTGDPASAFVDTLQPVATPLSLPVQLVVLPRAVLDDIVGQGFPNGIDATRGHAILRFVDDARVGISGVTLVSPPAMTTNVAYDVGDTYSDQRTETDLRGTMVLLNLPSVAYPGSATTIGVNLRGTRHDVPVQLANGAVTVVTAVIPR